MSSCCDTVQIHQCDKETFLFPSSQIQTHPSCFTAFPLEYFFLLFFSKDKIKTYQRLFLMKRSSIMMCRVPELRQCSILDLMSQKFQCLHLNSIYPGVINNSIIYYVYPWQIKDFWPAVPFWLLPALLYLQKCQS